MKRVITSYKPGKKNGQKGVTKVEADGFQGEGCEAATKKYRDALGTETKNERKPEYKEGDFETEAESEAQFE